MKINPGWRPLAKDIKPPEHGANNQVNAKSFSEFMKRPEEQAGSDQLKRMLDQIQQQADRLSRTLTVRELRQYKLLVKQFLEETARRGIQLRDTRGWDRRGRSKRYKLLEEIDAALLELADELLEKEQSRIELLQRVGEIRGMLINLLF
ncbi:hypothetical protein J31TS4_46610 [Paenibacillus sp. J31TS4]|uniref:YaaR family protein n=1 Tax=Paenibacillus sp. J31TS4 TaxID=2807195 RepID=UPI001B29763F|nr:YaaR family protein [Paenibacillus sp. J31TS4]GIP41381.1 hypothetical protein J31TS4_46610 [Paenibacillus sp. J31TS4]